MPRGCGGDVASMAVMGTVFPVGWWRRMGMIWEDLDVADGTE